MDALNISMPNEKTIDGHATPIFDLIMSQYHGSTLVVFGRRGLFDYIHSKGDVGVSVEELATHANWSIRATSAMMVSLVTNDILCVLESPTKSSTVHSFMHRYKLSSSAANFLCSDVPGSVVPYLELFWDITPKLLLEKASAEKKQDNYMLETGEGAPSELFISAMQGQTSHAAMTLSQLLDLSNTEHFVDVGGGSGVFCLEVCKTFPNMTGSIYELTGVCPVAKKFITKANLNDRVKAIAGNMFDDEVFPTADCYGFGNILHDWSDDANKGLLKKAFVSLPENSNGKVILLEMLVAEDVTSTTRAAAGLNLVMVTNEDGRQYKFSEFKAMLENIGFVDIKAVSSPLTPFSAVIATKP